MAVKNKLMKFQILSFILVGAAPNLAKNDNNSDFSPIIYDAITRVYELSVPVI